MGRRQASLGTLVPRTLAHIFDQCGVSRKMIKWQPFPTGETHRDTRLATCQENRCGAGKIARQALPGNQ